MISSSWRLDPGCVSRLYNAGLTVPIIGCTPNMKVVDKDATRETEILWFLDNFEKQHPSDSISYVVLDDAPIEGFNLIKNHYIQLTDGLQEGNLYRLTYALGYN